jgi:hypothetical protein
LKIRNFRSGYATSSLINYLDNVYFAPLNPMLSTDRETFSCYVQTTTQFGLNAGITYANHPYLILLGISNSYPGFSMDDADVPLNWDFLVSMSFGSPGFAGPGFFGQLDANGQATASMTVPPDLSLMDLAVFYSYIVLSPGPSTPVLAASNPVNTLFVQ